MEPRRPTVSDRDSQAEVLDIPSQYASSDGPSEQQPESSNSNSAGNFDSATSASVINPSVETFAEALPDTRMSHDDTATPPNGSVKIEDALRDAWTSAGGDPSVFRRSSTLGQGNSVSFTAAALEGGARRTRSSFDNTHNNEQLSSSWSTPMRLDRTTAGNSTKPILNFLGRSNSTSSAGQARRTNPRIFGRAGRPGTSGSVSQRSVEDDQEVVIVDRSRNPKPRHSQPILGNSVDLMRGSSQRSHRSQRSFRRRSIIGDNDAPDDLEMISRASGSFITAADALERAGKHSSVTTQDWHSGWHSTGPYFAADQQPSASLPFVNPFLPFSNIKSQAPTTGRPRPFSQQYRPSPPIVRVDGPKASGELSHNDEREGRRSFTSFSSDSPQEVLAQSGDNNRTAKMSRSFSSPEQDISYLYATRPSGEYSWLDFDHSRAPSASMHSSAHSDKTGLPSSRPSYSSTHEDAASFASDLIPTDRREPPSRTSLFKLLRNFATAKEKFAIVIGLILAAVAGLTRPLTSIILGLFTNAFTEYGANRNQDSRHTLLDKADQLAVYVVLIGIASLVCGFGSNTIFQTISTRIVRRLRKRLFDQGLLQEVSFHDQAGSSHMINLIDTEAHVIQEAIGDKVAQFALYTATFISGFIIAVIRQWKLGLVLGLTVLPTILGAGATFQTLVAIYATKASQVYTSASSISEEIIASIRTVYAFDAQNKLLDRYYDKLESSLKFSTMKSFFRAMLIGSAIFIIFSAYALAFYYGTVLVIDGSLTAGDVITVFFAILVSCLGLTSAAPVLDSFTRAGTATSNIYRVLLREPILARTGFVTVPQPSTQDLVFRDVEFHYPTRQDIKVLKKVNLRIKSGQTTALVGGSGSGKSTLLQLLLRFYEPIHGNVTLGDEYSLNELDLRWYRQNIGYLPQEPHLFSVSVRENVLLGLKASEKSNKSAEDLQKLVEDACMKAFAHDFIIKLPQRYDTPCGDRGSLLSGGQKQRVALARAIISNPSILMFDEPTSALDAESEAYVQEALDQVCIGKTTITVAHRLSTIRNADTIVVMKGGEVAESGTHDELFAADGEYAQMVSVQQPNGVTPAVSPLPAIESDMDLEVDPSMDDLVQRGGRTLGTRRSVAVPKRSSSRNLFSNTIRDGRSRQVSANGSVLAPPRSHMRPMSVDQNSEVTLIDPDARFSSFTDGKLEPSSPVSPASTTDERTPFRPEEIDEKESTIPTSKQSTYVLVNSGKKHLPNSTMGPAEDVHLPLWFTSSRILRMARGFRWLLIVSAFMCIVSGALYPVLAIILGKLIDAYQAALATNDTDTLRHYGNFYGLLFFVLALAGLISLAIEWSGFSSMADRLAVRIRLNIVDALLHLPVEFFDEKDNSSAALVSFIDSSASNIVGLAGSTMGAVLESVFTLIAGAVVSIVFGWRLALVTIASVPVVILLGVFRGRRMAVKEKQTRELFKEAVLVVGQTFSGFRVVAAYPAIADSMSDRFQSFQEAPSRLWIKRTPQDTILFGTTQMCLIWIIALAFWYGSREIAADRFTVGQFYTVFIAVVFGAMHAGTMLLYASDISKAKSMSRNVIGLIAKAAKTAPRRGKQELTQPVEGRIEFDNVHFAYPSRPKIPILGNMNFTIEPGQSVAFVGESGSGKSTITTLLYRFYESTKGCITLDGRNITDLDLFEYRSQMAFVQQEPVLFNGTIRFNVCLGCEEEDPDDDEIMEACEEAGIAGFIEGLPHGLDTDLGSRGASLSGGQKQRIAIARALIRKPKILVLDEATSALDAESERHVQMALDKASRGRTTITIAHRLATVARCDKIFVLAGGRIVDSGTHAQLTSRKGFYSRMASRQTLS